MNLQDKILIAFKKYNIDCDKIRYLKDPALLVDIFVKGQFYHILIAFSDHYSVHTIEVNSSHNIDPVATNDVQKLLQKLNQRRKKYLWYLAPLGYYGIGVKIISGSLIDVNKILALAKSVAKKYALHWSYIEDLAHGRKSYEQVYREMDGQGLIK